MFAEDIGNYILHLNDVLVTDLSKAPPIKKDNLPPVCRSTILEHITETLTRVTINLFFAGELAPLECELNRRSNNATFLLNGKMLKQFYCEDPESSQDLPYITTHKN